MKFVNYINEYDEDQIKKANLSSRSKGAVGSSPLGFRYVLSNVDKTKSVLDFGAGKAAAQTFALKEQGFKNVTAYEFGKNLKDFHEPNALNKKYDVVMVNNVLNVQSNEAMLDKTLGQILNSMHPGSICICNFPASPRYCKECSTKGLEAKLSTLFKTVERVGGTSSAPLWKCTK